MDHRLDIRCGGIMRSYYHTHEQAYQQIVSRGGVGWGDAKTLAEMSDPKTKQFVLSTIEEHFPDPKGLKALDLGCGAGPSCFWLAEKGFDVTGVDVSETALGLAKNHARELGLTIKFQICDILQLETLSEKFDLIYDSHCLHCIVFDEDRRRTLDSVRESLKPDGIFVLDTMAFSENQEITRGMPTLRFDDEFILWHETTQTDLRGSVPYDNKIWCAQRRIYPLENILDEVQKSGFSVVSQVVDKNEKNNPNMLRLVCS
jgi:2-polyprenyl-3-methyl-5-hydroxy-6-metoxy-1,4-benzoquinol methylase